MLVYFLYKWHFHNLCSLLYSYTYLRNLNLNFQGIVLSRYWLLEQKIKLIKVILQKWSQKLIIKFRYNLHL